LIIWCFVCFSVLFSFERILLLIIFFLLLLSLGSFLSFLDF